MYIQNIKNTYIRLLIFSKYDNTVYTKIVEFVYMLTFLNVYTPVSYIQIVKIIKRCIYTKNLYIHNFILFIKSNNVYTVIICIYTI